MDIRGVRTKLAAGALLLGVAGLGQASGSGMDLVTAAGSDPALRATLEREGQKAATFCVNCHGESGNSKFEHVPNLAAQDPRYLVGQIEAFLAGTRRDDFMQGLMKVLNEREKAAISLYFSAQTARPASATVAAGAAAGKVLYDKHCVRCHMEDGRGTDAFPRIAGQQPEYLRTSLNRYLLAGSERFSAQMSAAVIQLGKENIVPVVEYLTSLDR